VHANTGEPDGPGQGLSANQIARALISMMAQRTTCSKKRPVILMQDRNLLQRTARPYIGSKDDFTKAAAYGQSGRF
jgi:hypothetical protein